MKTRLNLTIEEQLLDKVKQYAAQKHTSVSEMVESYFKTVTRPAGKKSILDIIESLPTPAVNAEGDLKKQYYEENAGKYGF
ncbi:hypothetical protein SAMN05216436_106112 [bacterium A37T11]|nr:hypothetical protein SAMN05216436_106112 [bacterium A37T11]